MPSQSRPYLLLDQQANIFSKKQTKTKKANAFSEKQTKAKKGDTVTDTDTVTVTDIDHPLPPKRGAAASPKNGFPVFEQQETLS